MKAVRYTPKETTSYHFGDDKGNLKTHFSSDQLFSALIHCMTCYGETGVKEAIVWFLSDQLRISSLFYGLDIHTAKADKTFYFLPKPEWFIGTGDEVRSIDHKRIKRAQYISHGALEKLLLSWDEEKLHFNYDLGELTYIGTQFAITKTELQEIGLQESSLDTCNFINTSTRPRIEMDRFKWESQSFYFQDHLELRPIERDSFSLSPFFFFLYTGEMPRRLKTAVRILADEGIGGKRSIGYGHLGDVEFISHVPIHSSMEKNYYLNLATYFPQQEETSALWSYSFDKRSGYIYSQHELFYRRKMVRVIKEGSILLRLVSGDILDLAPSFFDHPVYLYGRPFLLGFGGDRDGN